MRGVTERSSAISACQMSHLSSMSRCLSERWLSSIGLELLAVL